MSTMKNHTVLSHDWKIGVAGFCAVAGLATILMAGNGSGPGGNNPNCFLPAGLSACSFYTDASPECPDTLLGGGTCGVLGSLSGFSSISPSGATCSVVMFVPNTKGDCIPAGQHDVVVGCSVPSGTSCGN